MVETSKPPSTNGENKQLITVESASELGKKAFALGKYEESVEFYAAALELFTEKHGDNHPDSADLLFLYGKALLENAVAQSAVLGKEDPDAATKAEEEDKVVAQKAAAFHFGGDAEEDDDGVVTFKQEGADGEDEDGGDGDEEEEQQDDDAPEDDFNAAWDVLDLARSLYTKKDDEATKMKLADTYIALGDVSLETEKFDQAISDYTSGLSLKNSLLPFHNRQIAEAHYKLGLVLDLTSGRLGDAITQVEKAVESITARLELLNLALSGPTDAVPASDAKGKGKGNAAKSIPEGDPIASLTSEQVAAEIKEFEGLRSELVNKIEDLRSAPDISTDMSAPALAALQLTKELNGQGASSSAATALSGPVNDLSGMIKKKKKPAAEADLAPPAPSAAEPSSAISEGSSVTGTTNGKRKAEDSDGISTPTEKKLKLDDTTS